MNEILNHDALLLPKSLLRIFLIGLVACALIKPLQLHAVIILPGGGPPTLKIESTNHNALVSWSGSNFWLQAGEFLESPALWYNAPWVVADFNDEHSSLVPLDAEARFFRLVQSTTLPPPTSLVAQAGDGDLYVTWNVVSNAASYNLYLATAPGVRHSNYSSLPGGKKISGLSGGQYVFYDLNQGVRYYCVVTAVAANGDESADSNEGSDIFGSYGQAHGSIYAELFDGVQTNLIFLPGVSVKLQEVGGNNVVAQISTDHLGQFFSASIPAGNYQLCWDATGFISDCNPQIISVSNHTVTLPPQKIEPLPGTGMVFGHVRLQDGSSPVIQLPMFGVDVAATLTLRNAAGNILGSAVPNSLGEYLMTGVPLGTNLVLSADLEAAHVQAALFTTVSNQVDLILPNSAPVIHSVTALLAGQPIDFAPPGTSVQVQASVTDAENHPLHFQWRPDIGTAGLATNDASSVALVLPSLPGPVRAFVLAKDGYGGYATERFDMETLTNQDFSGVVTVCGLNGVVVTNGLVRVNHHFTGTDTNGFFTLSIPATETNFLLTISASGFAPVQRTFTKSSVGQSYCLEALPALCTNWTGGELEVMDSGGTSILLQSNSLLYAGIPYNGPICVSIATYDPCAEDLTYPAGMDAIGSSNQLTLLQPRATASIQITDGFGQPLSIDPNKPAMITLPLGASCADSTNDPAMQPIWQYDSTNGVWFVIGTANKGIGAGNAVVFIAPVFQLGLLAVGQAEEKTVVTVVPDKTLNQPFLIRLSSQADPVLINAFVPIKPAVNFTVPRGKAVTIEVISQKEGPGEYYTNPNDVNSARALKDKTAIVRVQKTFTTAEAVLPLSLSNHLAGLMREDFQAIGESAQFLTFRTPPPPPIGLALKPNFYYTAIADWEPNRKDLFDWFQRVGFLPPGGVYPKDYTEDAHALYFNATDLGFARSMHMKKTTGADGKKNIAYYVINYRNLEDALADEADKPAAKISGLTVATVAMDYMCLSTNEPKRYTKFYVFNDNRALRPEADLDGNGNKLTPNLCVVCHGTKPVNVVPAKDDKGRVIRGKFALSPPDGDVGGRFIPFDPESFTYAKSVGVQQAQFRELNRGIYQHTPMTAAMSNLITGWYGGGLTNGNNNNFKVNYVPDGWTNHASLYLNTVRISCRGCHLMRENEMGFASYDDFSAVSAGFAGSGAVCSSLKMPNAQRTFSIFWGSEAANIIKPGAAINQPSQITNEFGKAFCPCPKIP